MTISQRIGMDNSPSRIDHNLLENYEPDSTNALIYQVSTHALSTSPSEIVADEGDDINKIEDILDLSKSSKKTDGLNLAGYLQSMNANFSMDDQATLKIDKSKTNINPMTKELLNLSTKEFSNHVQGRLPPTTFSRLLVRDIQYDFSNLNSTLIPTRLIKLHLKKSQTAARFFHAFFSGLGFISNGSANYSKRLDEETLKKELMSSIFEGKQNWQEINRAYGRATTISLYIAKDQSGIEIQLSKSKKIIAAYKVGHGIHNGAMIAMPVIIMAFVLGVL